MSGAILGEAAELCWQSAAPLLHGLTSRHFKHSVRCRFGSCELTSAYARYSEAHALPYSVIILYYPFDFVLIALFVFASEEKEEIVWLYLLLLLYHLTQHHSYRTASTILAGSGAVHSTQCSAHPMPTAWERSVTTPDAAITVHRQRLGPTDAPCGDHKTGSKAAVRHATRRPGLQILSRSTPFATGSQT